MYEIKDMTGSLLDTAPDVTYVRWGRNGSPKVCHRDEAEGVVLSDNITLCRIVDRAGLERYQKATVNEVSIDRYVIEMKNDTYSQNEIVMQSLSDAEADRELQSITQTENTETVMQALSDLQADVAMLVTE